MTTSVLGRSPLGIWLREIITPDYVIKVTNRTYYSFITFECFMRFDIALYYTLNLIMFQSLHYMFNLNTTIN
jgi:hypothetical protein